MTDEEFERYMSRLANGDKESLRYIYDAYLKLVYAVIYDTIGRREEAEDVTSEFFIKLYRIAGTYRKGNGHVRWLVTIAKNMAVDRVRKLAHEALVDEIPETYEEHGMEEQTVDRLTMQEAVKTLNLKEKEILDLKTIGGFTFREIAEMKNRPIGTVTWQYNQALNKLRSALKGSHPGGATHDKRQGGADGETR